MRKKWDEIENKIHELLGQHGISSPLQDIEMKQVFEDRPHERRQFILKVEETSSKDLFTKEKSNGFILIQHQKLKDEHVEAIETEIHEKVADQPKE